MTRSILSRLLQRRDTFRQIDDLCDLINARDFQIQNAFWTDDLCYKAISLVLKAQGQARGQRVLMQWLEFLFSENHPYSTLRNTMQSLLLDILDVKHGSKELENKPYKEAMRELEHVLKNGEAIQIVLNSAVQSRLTGEQLFYLAALDGAGKSLSKIFNYTFSAIANFFRYVAHVIFRITLHPYLRLKSYWDEVSGGDSYDDDSVVKIISEVKDGAQDKYIKMFQVRLKAFMREPLKYIDQHVALWGKVWKGIDQEALRIALMRGILEFKNVKKLTHIFRNKNIVETVFFTWKNKTPYVLPDDICDLLIRINNDELNNLILNNEKFHYVQNASYEKLVALREVLEKGSETYKFIDDIVVERSNLVNKTPQVKLKYIVDFNEGQAGFVAQLPEAFFGKGGNSLENRLIQLIADKDKATPIYDLLRALVNGNAYRRIEFVQTFPALWETVKARYLEDASLQSNGVVNKVENSKSEEQFYEYTFGEGSKWHKQVQTISHFMPKHYTAVAFNQFFRAMDGCDVKIGGTTLKVGNFTKEMKKLEINKALTVLQSSGVDPNCIKYILVNASMEGLLTIVPNVLYQKLSSLNGGDPRFSNSKAFVPRKVEIIARGQSILYREYESYVIANRSPFCCVTEITISPGNENNAQVTEAISFKILFKDCRVFKKDYSDLFDDVVESQQFKEWLGNKPVQDKPVQDKPVQDKREAKLTQAEKVKHNSPDGAHSDSGQYHEPVYEMRTGHNVKLERDNVQNELPVVPFEN